MLKASRVSAKHWFCFNLFLIWVECFRRRFYRLPQKPKPKPNIRRGCVSLARVASLSGCRIAPQLQNIDHYLLCAFFCFALLQLISLETETTTSQSFENVIVIFYDEMRCARCSSGPRSGRGGEFNGFLAPNIEIDKTRKLASQVGWPSRRVLAMRAENHCLAASDQRSWSMPLPPLLAPRQHSRSTWTAFYSGAESVCERSPSLCTTRALTSCNWDTRNQKERLSIGICFVCTYVGHRE